MAKKKSRTYAEEAKSIINKYKKRLGKNFEEYDPMSVKAMNRELEALMQKQEATRAQMLEADQVTAPAMAYGGNLPWTDAYSRSGRMSIGSVPTNPYMVSNNYTIPQEPNVLEQPVDNSLIPSMVSRGAPSIAGVPADFNPQRVDNPKPNAPQAGEKGDTWWGGVPTEAKIGAIAQGAGVIGSGIANIVGGRTDPLEYNPTSPLVASYVNNDEAIRQSNLAFQDAMRSSRGLSAGRYYSQMGKLASDRGRSAAGIAEQTANANAQIDNQVAAQNAQLSLQNEQGRMGAQQYNDAQTQQRAGYLGDMMGDVGKVVAGAGADSLAYKSEKNALNFIGQTGYTYVTDSKGKGTTQVNIGGGLSSYKDSGRGMLYFKDGNEIPYEQFKEERAAWRKLVNKSMGDEKPAKSK